MSYALKISCWPAASCELPDSLPGVRTIQYSLRCRIMRKQHHLLYSVESATLLHWLQVPCSTAACNSSATSVQQTNCVKLLHTRAMPSHFYGRCVAKSFSSLARGDLLRRGPCCHKELPIAHGLQPGCGGSGSGRSAVLSRSPCSADARRLSETAETTTRQTLASAGFCSRKGAGGSGLVCLQSLRNVVPNCRAGTTFG